jgi:hypothetical protein
VATYNGLLHGFFLPREATQHVSRDKDEQFAKMYREMADPERRKWSEWGKDYTADELAVAKDSLKEVFLFKFSP